MKIEILGPGCSRCRAAEAVVRKALAELKREAEIVHITDPVQFARRQVLLTPGVVVDGEVKSSGRVPELRLCRRRFIVASWRWVRPSWRTYRSGTTSTSGRRCGVSILVDTSA